MKKWMIVLAGTLLLMAGILTITATAANVVASGECGDNVTWTLDSAGVLVISGTGDMMDYDGHYLYPSYYDYRENIESVRIEDGVTNIGEYAFQEYDNLKNVRIGNSVTSIKQSAFYKCGSLKEIIIPDSVVNIHRYAFDFCASLENVTIPNSVTYIGDSAFSACHALHKIAIPDSVLSLGDNVFAGCWKLNSVSIGKGITSIVRSMFAQCYALDKIVIPDNITSIGVGSFVGTSLSSVIIPDSVAQIESDAFRDCASLASVIIGSGTTFIGQEAFKRCYNLNSIVIPLSMKTIIREAFENCDNLRDIYYAGSEAQWKQISVGSFNYAISDATKHYHSYGPNIGPYYAPIGTEPAPGDTDALRKAGEQKLQKLYQGFETAYANYTAKIRDILTEKGIDKQNTQVDYEEQAKKLMKADKDTGFVSITLGGAIGSNAAKVDERAKLHAYMAVCQMLNEKADAKGLDFSKIGFSDPLSAESKIVTQIRNSLSRYNKTFDYSGSEVTIRCLNAQVKKDRSAQFGSVIVKESIPGDGLYVEYTAVICTSVSDGEQLIAAYLNEMRDLMSNAVTNVYASLIQDLLGKSVSDLTTDLIKKKITGPVATKLAEHGLDKLADTLYNCYRYYKLCQDCTEITVDGMTFKDMEENAEKVQNFDFQTPAGTSAAKKVASKLEQSERDFMSGLYEFYTTGTITDKGFIGTIKRFFSGKCPISIEVLDASGKQVGYVGDDDLRYEEDTLLIEENGDEKRIYFLTDDPVSVRVTGTDYGTMNCTLEEYEDGTPTGRANFYDIALETGKSFAASLVTGDGVTKAEDLQLVEDGGGAISATEYLSASSSAAVRIDAQVDSDGGGTVTGGGVYVKGDAVVLRATANDNYAFIGWYGDDDAYLSGDIAYTFTAREDTTVTAYFAENYPSLANYMIEVSEIYQDIYDVAVEQDGDAFTVHVTRLADAVAGQDVCVFLANYADSGKMTALAQIPKTETATGMDFTGTVSERGSKLFILDEDFRPVISAYVSE